MRSRKWLTRRSKWWASALMVAVWSSQRTISLSTMSESPITMPRYVKSWRSIIPQPENRYIQLLDRLSFADRSNCKVSIALNPFTKGEYFVSFDDGTFCYNSAALGGHCEPPSSSRDQYTRTYKTKIDTSTTAKEEESTKLLKEEVRRGKEFDKLMKEWKVKEDLRPDSVGEAESEFDEWETVSPLKVPFFTIQLLTY